VSSGSWTSSMAASRIGSQRDLSDGRRPLRGVRHRAEAARMQQVETVCSYDRRTCRHVRLGICRHTLGPAAENDSRCCQEADFDASGDEGIPAAQPAVYCQIQHSEVASAAFDLKFRSSRQDVFGSSCGLPVSFPGVGDRTRNSPSLSPPWFRLISGADVIEGRQTRNFRS
jgi:hypothetical protein